MFGLFKKKARQNASFAQVQSWRKDPRMQQVLNALRGDCTIADLPYQEAVRAAADIAKSEGPWTDTDALPPLSQWIFLLWDDGQLPVLRVYSQTAVDHLDLLKTVGTDTYLVTESLDLIVHLNADGMRKYTV